MALFAKSVLYFCAFFAVLGIAWSQGLNGNGYIEKQLQCALDKAPCDNLGRQIKDALPEIIGNNCKACDQKQFSNAKRIAKFVQNKYPNIWNDLVRKYGKQTN